MARRRRNDEIDKLEAKLKAVGALFIIFVTAGSVPSVHNGLIQVMGLILGVILVIAVVAVIGAVVIYLVRKIRTNNASYDAEMAAVRVQTNGEWKTNPRALNPNSRQSSAPVTPKPAAAQSAKPVPSPPSFTPVKGTSIPSSHDLTERPRFTFWTKVALVEAISAIDWYQFEKFSEALLRAEGFAVERKGGAKPDGGVDLIATKSGIPTLVQCKHWRTWSVQEKVIREMLGSMSHFQVSRGAIFTLKGWTSPAADFAAQHQIELVDDAGLAQRALSALSHRQLDALLKQPSRLCPKCDEPLVERKGAFKTFWGCSTFPRCRGTIKFVGAR